MPWSPENEYLGFTPPNAKLINAYDWNFQVLRNSILQKRAKFALIYSLKVG